MSLLDKASLIVTPNAVKESKLYSVVPNTTLGDMDVVRATTATRVNSAGLIEVVPRNLYQYSNDFSNVNWSKVNATVTANQVGYDGTNNASLLVENTATNVHRIQQTPSLSGQTTISVYAKANTRNWLYIRGVQSGASVVGWFNLTNGTLGTIQTNGTGSITSIGNGWYRCSLTIADFQSGFETYIGLSNANSVENYLGNGSSIYIQNAQVEFSSTATEYFPTTTRLNIPRIDYTNGSCPSLLVEPQRTNLLTYSEQFDNAAWDKTGISVIANNTISPDGTQNADKVTEDISNGTHLFYNLNPLSASSTNTVSIFYKKGTRRYFAIKLQIGINSYTQVFDAEAVITGSNNSNGLTNVSTSIISISNGWVKATITGTDPLAGILSYAIFSLSNSLTPTFDSGNKNPIYQGTGTDNGYFWGAQLEAGSYPTSYIPTVASSVTRNADVISKTGISSLIGQTEGTMFFDGYFNAEGIQVICTIHDFANNKRIEFWSENNIIYGFVGASSNISVGETTIANGRHKFAIAYKSGDLAFYVDGNLIGTSSSTFTITLTAFRLDYWGGGTSYLKKQQVNSVQLYKTRLSNSELQSLTTL